MIMKNLTDHNVNLFDRDGKTVVTVYPMTGTPAAVRSASEWTDGLIVRFTPKSVEGIPEPQDGTFYIVSNVVRVANPERSDLVSPNGTVRNEDGAPIGCRSFIGNPLPSRRTKLNHAAEILGEYLGHSTERYTDFVVWIHNQPDHE